MLKDCSKIDLKAFAEAYFGKKKNAINDAREWLSNLSKKPINVDELFSLSNNDFSDEPIVYSDPSGQWWTGRYIGSIFFDGKSITIEPRFGIEFVANNMPLNNLIPMTDKTAFEGGDKFIHFLQAMLWAGLLTKAARHALPKVRHEQSHVADIARGKIDIRGTIKTRIKDKSKISSVLSYKEIKNPITVAIVLAFAEIQRWFPSHKLMHRLPKVVDQRLQQMIDAVPRGAAIPRLKEIKKARLGSIAKPYIPLMRLSLDIIKKRGISEKHNDNESTTFLLDVAELWEIYMMDVLQEAMPPQIEVIHGTTQGDKHLLTSGDENLKIGKLLPDYIFKDNGETVSIGDAKYKRLGDAPWMSPKRDDLYQMTAYLSRYSQCRYASFYYPDWDEEEGCSIAENNPWKLKSGQRINFIKVPIEKLKAVDLLKKSHVAVV